MIAVAARRAARLYARERSLLPVTLASQLLDGVRLFAAKGCWQPDGLSEEDIFRKYTQGHDEVTDDIYYVILKKSCTSNECVDAMLGLAHHASKLAEGAGYGL